MPSDYLKDLVDHKGRVAGHLQRITTDLSRRATVHDNSKFEPEEFDAYEQAFPGLQRYPYGSPEFNAELAKIQPALQHHYAANDHHPEHFAGGITQMNLVQLIEMVCDWQAASERSQASLLQSLEMNRTRFGIDDQLFQVVKNTIEWYAGRFLLVEPLRPGQLDGIANAEKDQP